MDRTSEDTAVFDLEFLLLFPMVTETSEDTIEWRHFRRKNLIELEAVFLPAVIESREGEGRLGFEEVIEAPLFHRSSLADMLDGSTAVAPGPDQLQNGINEVFFGIANSTHGANMVKVDERSTIFLRSAFTVSPLLSPHFPEKESLRQLRRPRGNTHVMRNRTPSSFALLTVLLPGIFLSACKPATGPRTKAEPPPPAVTVASPIIREVIDWDEFTGRLASPETVEIRSRVSGYLDEVHFKEGAEVEEGALLFTIDPRPYEAIVHRMEARVSSARSRAELAASEAKNAIALGDSQAISAEESQRRIKLASEAESILRAAEAELEEAKLNQHFTSVHAPIAGRLSDARVTKGNLVTGGIQDASLLTTIVSLDPIYCYLEADERSVLKYRELHRQGSRVSAQFGKVEAEMELANETGFPHKGFIDFVDNQLDATTGTIRARAVFENKDKLMAPGFFARVRIPGSGKYEGRLILDRAIADDQGRSFVWVIDAENTATYRPVVTGPLVDGLRVVREGIEAGERIVIDGVMAVRNGQKVNPEVGEMKVAQPVAP
jgi:RND family efflux transporter MFP subunit